MKPKILIFIDWFLPGYKAGGPITSIVNIIDHLKNDFTFYVITRNNDYGEKAPYADIEPNTWLEREKDVYVYYFSKDALNRKNIEIVASEAKCDTWYVTGVYSPNFSIAPVLAEKKLNVKRCIVVPRGMLSSHALGVKSLKKKLYLSLAKKRGFYKNVLFQATNEDEKTDIIKIFPHNRVLVGPNLPKPLKLDAFLYNEKKRDELQLISIARIAKEKNTLFAVQVLLEWSRSKFFSEEYAIQFDLYGQLYDKEYWNKCLGVIDQLPMNIIVTYKGSISPEEIPSVLSTAQILFMPTKGENYGHSIIEAMANERPVLISDRTPWRGLREKNVGWDLPLDDMEEYVKVIQAFLYLDQPDYVKMCRAAYAYAKEIIEDNSALEAHKRIFTDEG